MCRVNACTEVPEGLQILTTSVTTSKSMPFTIVQDMVCWVTASVLYMSSYTCEFHITKLSSINYNGTINWFCPFLYGDSESLVTTALNTVAKNPEAGRSAKIKIRSPVGARTGRMCNLLAMLHGGIVPQPT